MNFQVFRGLILIPLSNLPIIEEGNDISTSVDRTTDLFKPFPTLEVLDDSQTFLELKSRSGDDSASAYTARAEKYSEGSRIKHKVGKFTWTKATGEGESNKGSEFHWFRQFHANQ